MNDKENIGLAIQLAQLNTEIYPFISRQVSGTLATLGMGYGAAVKWLEDNVKDKQFTSLFKFESDLHESLSKYRLYENLSSAMKQRARAWFSAIEKHLLRGSVLDLGGGSGEVASLINEKGHSIVVADTINWLRYDLKFYPVEGEEVIGASEGAFDQVLLLTVFHHSNNPIGLIKEAFRVAKKRVVFVESVTEGVHQYMYGLWVDWFYNRVLHFSEDSEKKINVPGNLKPATTWEQLVWKYTGYTPTRSERLGIFQHLNPEEHHLFVYDK